MYYWGKSYWGKSWSFLEKIKNLNFLLKKFNSYDNIVLAWANEYFVIEKSKNKFGEKSSWLVDIDVIY